MWMQIQADARKPSSHPLGLFIGGTTVERQNDTSLPECRLASLCSSSRPPCPTPPAFPGLNSRQGHSGERANWLRQLTKKFVALPGECGDPLMLCRIGSSPFLDVLFRQGRASCCQSIVFVLTVGGRRRPMRCVLFRPKHVVLFVPFAR